MGLFDWRIRKVGLVLREPMGLFDWRTRKVGLVLRGTQGHAYFLLFFSPVFRTFGIKHWTEQGEIICPFSTPCGRLTNSRGRIGIS